MQMATRRQVEVNVDGGSTGVGIGVLFFLVLRLAEVIYPTRQEPNHRSTRTIATIACALTLRDAMTPSYRLSIRCL